jgi:hypothetical protein
MTDFEQAYANLCARLGDLTIKQKQINAAVLQTENEIAKLLQDAANARQLETAKNEQQTKST